MLFHETTLIEVAHRQFTFQKDVFSMKRVNFNLQEGPRNTQPQQQTGRGRISCCQPQKENQEPRSPYRRAGG